MKKRLIAVAMTGALCAGSVLPALAATGGGSTTTASGTDIYAGITLNDPDAKIKVEVPTLFAFVVNGTVDTNATGAVKSQITLGANSTEEATILLPNIKVSVIAPSSVDAANAPVADGTYSVQTVGDGNMKFTNYSTRRATTADTAANSPNAALVQNGRIGLEVNVLGSIRNEGSSQSRNYWEHVGNADTTAVTGVESGFKKYTVEIDGKKFNRAALDGSLSMDAELTLDAPVLTNGNLDTTTNFAVVGTVHESTFNVYIGGQRKQYNQVEESAKVGTIVWTVRGDEQQGAITAPNNSYLPQQP